MLSDDEKDSTLRRFYSIVGNPLVNYIAPKQKEVKAYGCFQLIISLILFILAFNAEGLLVPIFGIFGVAFFFYSVQNSIILFSRFFESITDSKIHTMPDMVIGDMGIYISPNAIRWDLVQKIEMTREIEFLDETEMIHWEISVSTTSNDTFGGKFSARSGDTEYVNFIEVHRLFKLYCWNYSFTNKSDGGPFNSFYSSKINEGLDSIKRAGKEVLVESLSNSHVKKTRLQIPDSNKPGTGIWYIVFHQNVFTKTASISKRKIVKVGYSRWNPFFKIQMLYKFESDLIECRIGRFRYRNTFQMSIPKMIDRAQETRIDITFKNWVINGAISN